MKEAYRLSAAFKNYWIGSALLAGLMTMTGITAATSDAQSVLPDNSLESYTMPDNWKKYFEDKYGHLESISSTVQETPQGPNGSLHISGHLKVNVEDTAPGEKVERARDYRHRTALEQST